MQSAGLVGAQHGALGVFRPKMPNLGVGKIPLCPHAPAAAVSTNAWSQRGPSRNGLLEPQTIVHRDPQFDFFIASRATLIKL